MPYKYKLHPSAQKEYESSVLWYLERSNNAASKFVKVVEKGLYQICSNPKSYRNQYKHYFEYTLRRYPFTIIYMIEEEQQLIVIIAIYHQSRKPENKYR